MDPTATWRGRGILCTTIVVRRYIMVMKEVRARKNEEKGEVIVSTGADDITSSSSFANIMLSISHRNVHLQLWNIITWETIETT